MQLCRNHLSVHDSSTCISMHFLLEQKTLISIAQPLQYEDGADPAERSQSGSLQKSPLYYHHMRVGPLQEEKSHLSYHHMCVGPLQEEKSPTSHHHLRVGWGATPDWLHMYVQLHCYYLLQGTTAAEVTLKSPQIVLGEDKLTTVIPLERCDTSDKGKVRTLCLVPIDGWASRSCIP